MTPAAVWELAAAGTQPAGQKRVKAIADAGKRRMHVYLLVLQRLFERGARRMSPEMDVASCGEELQQIYHEQGMAIQKKSVGKADHSLLVQSILSWFIDEEWRQAVAACSSKEKETLFAKTSRHGE